MTDDRTAAVHEASHWICAAGARCRPGGLFIRRDGSGHTAYRSHSAECRRGGWCSIAGPIANAIDLGRLDSALLARCEKDFAIVRGIATADSVAKVGGMLSRRWRAVEALAAALISKRRLDAKEAARIVRAHPASRTASKTFRLDALDNVIARVERRDLSELAPPIERGPDQCLCDLKTPGKPGACRCDDPADLPFEVIKDSIVILFEDGPEAQKTYWTKQLAALNRSRAAKASKEDLESSMKTTPTPTTDDLEDGDDDDGDDPCCEDEDRDETCDECSDDDEDSDAIETLDSSASVAERRATAAMRKRTALAYRDGLPVPKPTTGSTSTNERAAATAMRRRSESAWARAPKKA
jgi:hypothetical protein